MENNATVKKKSNGDKLKILGGLALLGNIILAIFIISLLANERFRDSQLVTVWFFMITTIFTCYVLTMFIAELNSNPSDSGNNFLSLYFKRKKLEQIARIKELEGKAKD